MRENKPNRPENPKTSSEDFYTLTGYQQREQAELTPAMEDYLEMICRLAEQDPVVRRCEIAGHLHVSPASASKMTQQLKDEGYINAEKYGYVSLTDKGRQAGEYLLFRHQVLHRFLCALNQSDNELEQAEKLEHFLNRTTVQNLWQLTKRLEAGETLDKTPPKY